MSIPKVTVYINSTLHHFSQLLAGLEFLNSENKIELKYILDLGIYPADIFKIEYNDLNIYFDLADNSRIYEKIYEQSDFYVKRMLLKSDAEIKNKLIPYGLYYPVYFKNSNLKYLFLQNLKLYKYSLKYWKLFSWILNIKDGIAVNELKKLESYPNNNKLIIFRARLWNPANNDVEWKKKERIHLNQQRIDVNRILKENYPINFSGGILKDSYSIELCPDIIIDPKEFHRKNYLIELRKSSIGIANHGLEDSIGAKIGEYVSHSLAILTTNIDKFLLHGQFAEGENFYTFKTAEECLNLVNQLSDNNKLRHKLQNNNIEYYKKYLHPGEKVSHILRLIDQA